jgi:hemophore-related protein
MLVSARIATGAGVILAGMAFGTAATATALPPDCTSADLAGVHSGVASAAANYLFTHPDVNTFLTGLKGMPREEQRVKVEEYLQANPQVRTDFQNIRQPTRDFRARCGIPEPEGIQPAAPG